MNLLLLLTASQNAVETSYTKGWIVTIVGFLIVLVTLWALSLIFRGIAMAFTREKKAAVKTPTKKTETPKEMKDGIPSEVLTAISLALYLSTEVHDEESNVITIRKRETAWNSKSYGIRNWNR